MSSFELRYNFSFEEQLKQDVTKMRNGGRGTGDGERGTGNGVQGTGNGEWGTGELKMGN